MPGRCSTSLGTIAGAFRGTRTPCRAARPFDAAITPQDCTEHEQYAEQDRLKRVSHDEDGLRPPMPQGDVCQIEQRRPVRRPRVHDLKYGLQVSIQINDRTRPALECQWLIPLIPPAMRYPTWELHGLAWPCLDALATDLRGQGAGCHHSILILEVMNVQRGALLMRGQAPPEAEDQLPILRLPPKLEDLAGVPVLQSQMVQ